MVSFSCENCGDVLTKKKLDPHRNQCRGASYTCLDCMVHFQGTDYRSHTSCMSEAQKYEGALYRDPKTKQKGQKSVKIVEPTTAIVPRKAYVQDEAEEENTNGYGTVAVIDVPPAAPSPPPAASAIEDPTAGVNVFDFLVTDESPNPSSKALAAGNELQAYDHPVHGDSHYTDNGYSYGHTPVEPGYARYDSWASLPGANGPPPPYVTPAPKHKEKERDRDSSKKDKSSNKRKRHQLEELDMSRLRSQSAEKMVVDSAAPVLHSGLTGGLSRLLSRPEELLAGELGHSPLSPLKRSKKEREERRTSGSTTHTQKTTSTRRHDEENDDSGSSHDDRGRSHRHTHRSSKPEKKHRTRRSSSSSDEHRRPSRKQIKAIDYKPQSSSKTSASPPQDGERALIRRETDVDAAELFLSFVTKGPDSERGWSVNKALKKYHREQGVRGDREKEERDKELWKGLRMRRNERGEVVLFF